MGEKFLRAIGAQLILLRVLCVLGGSVFFFPPPRLPAQVRAFPHDG
jgi:hypothetical protein